MGLAKSIKAVLGIAASGGFALFLSGSAYAAETTPADTTQPTVTSAAAETPKTATSDKAGVVTSPVQTPKDSTGATVPAATTTDKPQTTVTPAPGVGNSPALGEAAVIPGATVTPAKAEAAVIAPVSREAATPAVAAALLPAGPIDPIVSAVTTDAAVENVQVGAAVMLVQPKITPNHPLLLVDLATFVPSAPIHRNEADSAPMPSQPSGVLGRLTASLAEVVVPNVFLTPTSAFDGMAATVALMILMSLLFAGRRPAFTFGEWLRRGGYAHAARSDVVTAVFTPNFATPSILSYATAPGPTDSSFLMVSDSKTLFSMVPNAIRKED